MAHKVGILGGDGIGPEVIAEGLKVIAAAGVDLDTVDYDLGGARYLRVTMNLELKDEDTVALVQERLPLVRNGILMVLPAKKYADISTVEGKGALRDALVAKLNSFLKSDSVANIYFTEFVVQ